jgi:hypothetical protein
LFVGKEYFFITTIINLPTCGGEIMALTELEVKKAKATDKQQKLSDGSGLYLLIHPNGGKHWQMEYRFGGKQKTLSLGVHPVVSLADVRDRREQARKLLANDTDPSAIKRATKQEKRKTLQVSANSFSILAAEFHKVKSPMWTAGHANSGCATWRSTQCPL